MVLVCLRSRVWAAAEACGEETTQCPSEFKRATKEVGADGACAIQSMVRKASGNG